MNAIIKSKQPAVYCGSNHPCEIYPWMAEKYTSCSLRMISLNFNGTLDHPVVIFINDHPVGVWDNVKNVVYPNANSIKVATGSHVNVRFMTGLPSEQQNDKYVPGFSIFVEVSGFRESKNTTDDENDEESEEEDKDTEGEDNVVFFNQETPHATVAAMMQEARIAIAKMNKDVSECDVHKNIEADD